MLVVLPTYRRLEWLRYALHSLFRSELPSGERPRLCLVSNYPPKHDQVADLVESAQREFDQKQCWHVDLVRRPKTLDAIENWYSAIREHAKPDEMVVLNGDDDLFTPWGLVHRHHALQASGADMLLTRSCYGLTYLDSERYVMRDDLPETEPYRSPVELDWPDITSWGPAFIGNHVYRWTRPFAAALETAFEWCHNQEWLDENSRTLMLPYYLPFAVKHVGGRVCGLDSVCAIRGTSLAECIECRYGTRGWNSLFLDLCAYGVLTSPPLNGVPGLDGARRELLRLACRGYAGFFLDDRISRSARRDTFARVHPPWRRFPLDVVFSFRTELTHVLRLRALRLKLALGCFHPMKTTELIEALGKSS